MEDERIPPTPLACRPPFRLLSLLLIALTVGCSAAPEKTTQSSLMAAIVRQLPNKQPSLLLQQQPSSQLEMEIPCESISKGKRSQLDVWNWVLPIQ